MSEYYALHIMIFSTFEMRFCKELRILLIKSMLEFFPGTVIQNTVTDDGWNE